MRLWVKVGRHVLRESEVADIVALCMFCVDVSKGPRTSLKLVLNARFGLCQNVQLV